MVFLKTSFKLAEPDVEMTTYLLHTWYAQYLDGYIRAPRNNRVHM